jgi:cytochrome P450 family 6
MKYLDCCINEALRAYPPLPMLSREASKDYLIPGTNTLIEKGTSITIPIFGIQHDPRYFPEPEKFLPERFYEKETFEKSMKFLSFGNGPRNFKVSV